MLPLLHAHLILIMLVFAEDGVLQETHEVRRVLARGMTLVTEWFQIFSDFTLEVENRDSF